MPINGYNTPNIPISTGISQLIVQEHNVIGTTWRQVVVCFTANANYDYLWFYPQSLTTGYSGAIFVDRVELIPIPLNFAGSDHTIPCGNVSIGQDICTVDNLHFQWHIAGQADIIASTSETMVNVETTTVYELNIVPQNANPNTIVFPAQPNNCNLTDQATVIVTGGITLTPFTTDGCEACDASAQVIPAGGTPPYLYQWDALTGSQVTQTAINLCSGTYSVQVIDQNYCAAEATINVTDAPELTVIAVLTHPTCLNSSDGAIDITVTGGTPPYTYVWTTIGGSGLTPGTQDQTGLTAGLYQVIVTDANGCEVKEEYVLIGQNSAPIAAFDIEEDCLYASQTIHFIDQSTVTGLPIYSWNFGDGSFDFSQNPAHPYTYDGFYCIQLTVTNICGTATESKPIYVMPSDCSCDPSITYYYTDGDLISSYCTIPNNSNIRGTVTIMPNVTVNIPNNATIRFAANAKLIVMPNATLNIGTGAILTSLAGCNEMWQGIEVWSNKLNRGNVFISTAATSLTQGATISNAHIGVLLGSRNLEKICNTGANQYANNAQTGRIIARYVKFHNDGTGIYFTTPIYTNANYCSIRDCEFRTNGILFDPMYDIDNNPHYTAGQNNDHNPFIEMANRRGVGNHGIRMEKANDIVFGNNWFWYLDAGMESFDNRYTVEGSHFNFCKYGIRINNTNIFINTPHNINSNYFDNIPGYAGDFGYAICVVSSRNDNILRNVFGTYSSVNNINSNGILLSNSGGFNIKDNEFWYFKKGISVYNSGKGGGFIGPASTGNKFKRCNESIFTSGTNLWLKIRCNEFTNDDPSYYSGNTWSNWGALANQGSFPPLSTVYPDRWPAGNRFLSPNDKEISTLSGVGTTYHYVHHASPFYTIPWPINVILDPTTYPMGSTSCYTEAKIGTDINGLTYQKDSLDNIVAELKYQLLIVTSNLDKGNTSGLLSAINSNLAQGKLKNMLVNHSPLSNTVISELMASDGRLSPGNYKNVMEKNLPVNREIEPLFLEDLQGLPPGIAMQLQALNGNNPSVVTTASIIRQIDRADMMRNQVLSALYNEIVGLGDIDFAMQLLENENTTDADQTMVGTYINIDALTEAEAKLGEIQDTSEEVSDWKVISEILLNLYSDSLVLYQMDSIQEQTVRNIAYKCFGGIGTANARSILRMIYSEDIEECEPGEITAKQMRLNNDVREEYFAEQEYFLGMNYPNPAGELTIIPYRLTESAEGSVRIYDINGRLVAKYYISGSGLLEINTRKLRAGVYTYCLHFNGCNIEHNRMTIIK